MMNVYEIGDIVEISTEILNYWEDGVVIDREKQVGSYSYTISTSERGLVRIYDSGCNMRIYVNKLVMNEYVILMSLL